MTDEERFEAVLHELGCLLSQLGDLSGRAVLIGGQVLAVEALRRTGSAGLEVRTETDVVITRGFTFEPDVLFALEEDDFQSERLVEVLHARGYTRRRSYRWERLLEIRGQTVTVSLDLFAPPGVPPQSLPTAMTPLPDAEFVMTRVRRIEVNVNGAPLGLAIPDPAAFLAMKVRAKVEQRPTQAKDSFDIYAYVNLLGPRVVLESLAQAGEVGRNLRRSLSTLFHYRDSPGVDDVVQFAPGLSKEEEMLLRQGVVDLFSELD